MHIETERKFLVKDTSYKDAAVESHHLVQGYICASGGRTVRVRLYDDTGYLTIKGPSADGLSRMEWEKEIPLQDAKDLFALCIEGVIDKTRWIVPEESGILKFEVDEFHGENAGLTVAEIELPSPDYPFTKPAWIAEEVTGQRKYYNSHLSKLPFTKW
jgi:CYTH domain-containing protein